MIFSELIQFSNNIVYKDGIKQHFRSLLQSRIVTEFLTYICRFSSGPEEVTTGGIIGKKKKFNSIAGNQYANFIKAVEY